MEKVCISYFRYQRPHPYPARQGMVLFPIGRLPCSIYDSNSVTHLTGVPIKKTNKTLRALRLPRLPCESFVAVVSPGLNSCNDERSLPRRSGRSYWGGFNRGDNLQSFYPASSIQYEVMHVLHERYILK